MSIITGQDARLQAGLGSGWGENTKSKYRFPFMSESFKGTPNYKEAEALVGAKTTTSMAIMSMKADGGFKSYITPDLIKILLFCGLGRELARTVDGATTQQIHKYVPIPSGVCRDLPMLTVEVDRLLEKALYSSFKFNSWSIDASMEDYAFFETDGSAYCENIQNRLIWGAVTTFLATTPFAVGTLTVPTGLILANDEYNGKVVRIFLGCEEFYGVITDTVLATNILTLGVYGDTTVFPGSAVGWNFEVLDWVMTPQILLSTKEYFRFVHGRLSLEGSMAEYVVHGTIGDGRVGETVPAVPVTIDGTVDHPLILEARNNLNQPCVYQYTPAIPAAVIHTGIITFASPGVPASGTILPIHTGGVFNSANWTLVEELYDEATTVKLSYNNSLKEGQFSANGSMYQSEVQPQKREISIETSMRMSKRYSELRRKKMLLGATVKIQLEFVTSLEDIDGTVNTSIDSTGHPYRVVVDLPSCYHVDGIPNIDGPDEPTVSAKFTAREIPGVQEAITISVYDDVAFNIAGEDQVRTDGLA